MTATHLEGASQFTNLQIEDSPLRAAGSFKTPLRGRGFFIDFLSVNGYTAHDSGERE